MKKKKFRMYKHMKKSIPQGNPYEGDYLDQIAERKKQKKLEEQGIFSDSSSNVRKDVKVGKMGFKANNNIDVSEIKGCGKCQEANAFPMCPGK